MIIKAEVVEDLLWSHFHAYYRPALREATGERNPASAAQLMSDYISINGRMRAFPSLSLWRLLCRTSPKLRSQARTNNRVESLQAS